MLALQLEHEGPDLGLEDEVLAKQALDLWLHAAAGEAADTVHNRDQEMVDNELKRSRRKAHLRDLDLDTRRRLVLVTAAPCIGLHQPRSVEDIRF